MYTPPNLHYKKGGKERVTYLKGRKKEHGFRIALRGLRNDKKRRRRERFI
jgi:hypothetical protein